MKAMAIIFTALALLVGLCTTPAKAEAPLLPHAFYGTVEINGHPAAIGTHIEARGEGVLINVEGNPILVTEVGQYGGASPLEPKLTVQGDIADGATLTFYVNGVLADQTARWHSGAVTELNLTVTIPLAPPKVTTSPATAISSTAATLNGILSDLGDASPVEVSFEWGTTTDYGHETNEQAMTSTGSFNANLSGLVSNTSYHFRAKAVGEGTSYGIDRTFTTLGEAPAATFASSNLSISPSEVSIGETVTISVVVTNTSNLAGTYEVTLKINEVVETTREVTLDADASESVTFTTTKEVAGSYSVDVNGLSGSFTVKGNSVLSPTDAEGELSINWSVLGGVIAGLVIVGLITFFIVRHRTY